MNGETVAIVPIRSFATGKTRLAGVLSIDERRDLIKSMLMQVARAALDSDFLARVIVISNDPDALEFAADLDSRIQPLRQNAEPGLIPALNQARVVALAGGAASALVLFGDLPLIEPVDVRHVMRCDAAIVIAPDQHGTGTNALLLRDPALRDFNFRFGPDSFCLHHAEGRRLGIEPAISRSPGTLFDLDTADDWRALGVSRASIMRGEPARAFLQEATPR
jgi:2-phospho-L-lactate guanylyltransferase